MQVSIGSLNRRDRRVAIGWNLDLNDLVLDGVHNQVTNGVQTEFSHNVAAMCFHCFRAQVEQRGRLLGTFSLCKELRDFSLPGR